MRGIRAHHPDVLGLGSWADPVKMTVARNGEKIARKWRNNGKLPQHFPHFKLQFCPPLLVVRNCRPCFSHFGFRPLSIPYQLTNLDSHLISNLLLWCGNRSNMYCAQPKETLYTHPPPPRGRGGIFRSPPRGRNFIRPPSLRRPPPLEGFSGVGVGGI